MCFLQICLIQCWLISSSGLYSSRAWWPLKPYFCSWATRQFCESYTRHPGFHRFSAQGSLQFFLEHSFEKFYKLFWIQACPEGIGTNGTHRSHARCHPCPIPQPVKVGHTTRVYVPQSFWTVVWVLLRPTRKDQWKCCEMGPTVFCPHPREARGHVHSSQGKSPAPRS